jgi:hypothetical protein
VALHQLVEQRGGCRCHSACGGCPPSHGRRRSPGSESGPSAAPRW